VPVRRSEDQQEEIPLSGVRAEFRTALRAEIEAAKRTAATSVTPLVDGRKTGCLPDAFQYVFSAKSAINVPSDSPGELIIGGLPPAEALVVSVEGADVTLSVSVDLGDRVPQATLRSDLVFLLRRLITRIEQSRRKPNPAGDRLLGEVPASGVPEDIADPLLADTQDAAVASSLGRDITFIWAPPGAAKRQTVALIGAQLYRRSRSLLLVCHTNRAVDQAVVEIADRLGAGLGAGALLRLGIPCDPRLREREDLLLDGVVRKRQQGLRQRQAKLREQKRAKQRRIAESERLIGVAAWAAEGQAELADFLLRLHALRTRERTARHLAEEVARRASREAELLALVAEAQPSARSAAEAQRLRGELPQFVDQVDAAREAVSVAEAAVIDARRDYKKALELAPLVARERALPAPDEQRRVVEAVAVREAEAVHEVDVTREALRRAEERYATASNANAIQHRGRSLVFQIRFRLLVARRRAQVAAAEARLDAIRGQLGFARAVLAELKELGCRLAPWRKLGSPATREAHLKRREAERELLAAKEADLDERRVRLECQLAEATKAVEHFRKRHAVEPRGVVARVQPQLAELRHLRAQQREIGREADDLRKALDADLGIRLVATRALGLGRSSSPENARDRFAEVALAQFEARQLATETDVAAREAEVVDCRRELAPIDEELGRIDAELEAIRRRVITGAMVIATTLTRLHLWNEVQDRRFDTVIMDEASMAPIPALWLAARLADSNVVVVGDVGQLPPIKQSKHPLAEKWLGRDVFDASRVRPTRNGGNPPPHFVQLNSY